MMDPTSEDKAPGGVALLIIDMINDLDFPGGPEMLPAVEAATDAILKLRDAATRLGVPTVYVNDNYGQWHSERSRIVEYCSREESAAREIVQRIAPRHDDFFVIKPQFSGFYSTNLPVLLPTLGVNRLVLTGVAADICVLFTAADAHMRDYALWVPEDTVASLAEDRTAWSLDIMAKTMKAEIRPSGDLTLADWVADAT
jgi:nicotinamidase-related amidase